MPRPNPLFVLSSLLLAAACNGEPPPEGAGADFRSDTPEERCASAQVDDSGSCRASDGTFAPATCCALPNEFDEFACAFEEPIFVIDNSEELDNFVLDSRTVERADWDSLTSLQQQQIRAAAVHLSFLDGNESVETLFGNSVTDDENFILNDVIVDADIPFEGDWVKFFAGDTEVGVIFDVATLKIVAEVGDGDIMKCTAVEPTSVTCTFDPPSFGIDNTGELTDSIVDTTTIESSDLATLSDLRRDQIYAAAVHLSFLNGTEPVEAVFGQGVTDDENYIYNELAIDGDVVFDGDWLKFFAGDTEVGVIFKARTTDIVGEVSDGDIMACTLE